jgi:hypothetical protein
MLYFFYYAEFYVNGDNRIHLADGILTLPLDADLIFLDQNVRTCIQRNNPKVVRSTIVIKSLSRLG